MVATIVCGGSQSRRAPMLRNRLSSGPSSRLLAVVATAAVGCAVAACGSHPTAAGGSSAARLRIGISLSLTGDFADPGKAAQRGYQLWADTVNAHGGVLGRKVEL